jgi:phosphoribosylanthranilate isomerase
MKSAQIDRVTVTGADDDTSVSDLIKLGKKYPWVEVAILLSRNSAGSARYPEGDWIEYFFDELDREFIHSGFVLKTSGHLCGGWVREILLGDLKDDLKNLLSNYNFDRWQINTHGIKHKVDYPKFYNVLETFQNNDQSVIFQVDGANQQLIDNCEEKGFKNISALFDLSSGRGVSPESWPSPLDNIFCGYAGGLSPENVKENCNKIVDFDTPVWIDAETHLRSLDTDKFDLGRVEEFLENTKEFTRYR